MTEWYLEMTVSCESAPVAKKMVTLFGGRMPVLTARSISSFPQLIRLCRDW